MNQSSCVGAVVNLGFITLAVTVSFQGFSHHRNMRQKLLCFDKPAFRILSMISNRIQKFLAGGLSIAIAFSLTACSSSADSSAYEDCKAYSQELAEQAAAAFAEALNYTDQAEAMPYLEEAQAYNDMAAENDAKCEAL